VVLDQLLDSEDSFGTLQGHFARTAESTLNRRSGNVHSIKPVIRNAVNNSNNIIYVYLRPTSDHSVIVWDKTSLKVEAVLTPSRSR